MSDTFIFDTDNGPVLLSAGGIELENATLQVEPPPQEVPPPEEPPVTPVTRTTSVKPEEVPWDEWHRRNESVRTMAREFETLDHGDIREFLKGRVNRELTDDEVGQIKHDIEAQRVADIADILDEQLRSGSERLRRARRTVRVQAPRGWMKRTFNTLDERQVGQVIARLIQRGHEPDTIKDRVLYRVKDEETRSNLESQLDGDGFQIEFSTVAVRE